MTSTAAFDWRTIPARPVRFRGANMRSCLEREAARTLTYWGISWKYEPHRIKIGRGLTYLPDFQLWPRLPRLVYVEVKPGAIKANDLALSLALRRMELLHEVRPHAHVLFWLPDRGSVASLGPGRHEWHWAHGGDRRVFAAVETAVTS